MTDVPPDRVPDPAPPGDPVVEESPALPKWVPLLIGGILIGIGALAVFTGLRYRSNTLVHIVKPRRVPPAATAAPPGEPEAGGSLVVSGDNAPTAHPPVAGTARAVVSGTGTNVDAVVRMWARRAMSVNAVPEDALVYVNDVPVGHASQFKGPDQLYDFPAPGSYTVKVTAPGYRDRTFVVTAAEDAKSEIARIEAKLEKE